MTVMLLAALPAGAWDLRTDSEGDVVRWSKKVELVLQVDLPSKLHEQAATDAIATAVKNLDDATPYLDVTLKVGDAKPIGFVLGASDNTNSIVVLEDWPYAEGTLAVTLVTLNARTNELLDADIAFNAEAHQFRVLPANVRNQDHVDDVQNTITHELGHVLGLMHSTTSEDLVMYPSAPPGETCKRDLKTDDRDGLLSLYGTAPATSVVPPAPQLPNVGCSSTGTTSPVLAVLVLLGLTLLRRAPRRVAAIAAVVAPTLALAQDRLELPVALQRAEQVAMVQVVDRRSMIHPDHPGLIITELTVQPVECLKGSCPPPQKIVVAGGRVGDIEQVAVHEPVPAVGERKLSVRLGGRTRLFWARPDLELNIVRTLRLERQSPAPQGVGQTPATTP